MALNGRTAKLVLFAYLFEETCEFEICAKYFFVGLTYTTAISHATDIQLSGATFFQMSSYFCLGILGTVHQGRVSEWVYQAQAFAAFS
jgi:hypothetical protein